MFNKINKIALYTLTGIFFLLFSTSAHAEIKVGWLVDLTAHNSKITIDEALGFPEKKYVSYTIADDAKWHICTANACILKKGQDGYMAFKETVDKVAYGRPYKSFRVVLDEKEGKASALEIQITTKMH